MQKFMVWSVFSSPPSMRMRTETGSRSMTSCSVDRANPARPDRADGHPSMAEDDLTRSMIAAASPNDETLTKCADGLIVQILKRDAAGVDGFCGPIAKHPARYVRSGIRSVRRKSPPVPTAARQALHHCPKAKMPFATSLIVPSPPQAIMNFWPP